MQIILLHFYSFDDMVLFRGKYQMGKMLSVIEVTQTKTGAAGKLLSFKLCSRLTWHWCNVLCVPIENWSIHAKVWHINGAQLKAWQNSNLNICILQSTERIQ